MLPVLFEVVIPQGWGKPLLALVLVAIAAWRAVAYLHRARREGERATVFEALRDDAFTLAILAVAFAVVWAFGLLDRELRLPVHPYGLLIAAAFLLGIWLAQREARRRGQDAERIADLAFWIFFAALAGSRVYFAVVNWEDYFGSRWLTTTFLGRIPRLLVFWEGGLVFYGGFIAAALTAWWYMRRNGMRFLPYADTVIPSVAFGHFLGRLGCFASGCCWGEVARGHVPWATRFPQASAAFQALVKRDDPAAYIAAGGHTTLPLHPVQLYESFGELAIFLALVLVVRPRKRFHGQVLATWLLLYAILRTVAELFRGDVERGVFAGLGLGQWTSLVIFATGVAMWAAARKRPDVAIAGATAR